MNKKKYEFLTGRYHPDLVPTQLSANKLIHHEIIQPLNDLYQTLKTDHFELFIVSGYRNHLEQVRIWNEKVSGKRPISDESGNILDIKTLSNEDIVRFICRWSAIPGASRHHWGTDIDVICTNSLPNKDYQVQLIPEEVDENGIFGPFHKKLDELIKTKKAFNFYRPYGKDRAGVAPEKWHLSFKPLASTYLHKYTIDIFERNIIESNILLKEIILKDLEYFFKNFVLNVCRT